MYQTFFKNYRPTTFVLLCTLTQSAGIKNFFTNPSHLTILYRVTVVQKTFDYTQLLIICGKTRDKKIFFLGL